MAQGHYAIEISNMPRAMFISAVKSDNVKENYLIEREKSKANEIMKEFRSDYRLVCDNLQIIN